MWSQMEHAVLELCGVVSVWDVVDNWKDLEECAVVHEQQYEGIRKKNYDVNAIFSKCKLFIGFEQRPCGPILVPQLVQQFNSILLYRNRADHSVS